MLFFSLQARDVNILHPHVGSSPGGDLNILSPVYSDRPNGPNANASPPPPPASPPSPPSKSSSLLQVKLNLRSEPRVVLSRSGRPMRRSSEDDGGHGNDTEPEQESEQDHEQQQQQQQQPEQSAETSSESSQSKPARGSPFGGASPFKHVASKPVRSFPFHRRVSSRSPSLSLAPSGESID